MLDVLRLFEHCWNLEYVFHLVSRVHEIIFMQERASIPEMSAIDNSLTVLAVEWGSSQAFRLCQWGLCQDLIYLQRKINLGLPEDAGIYFVLLLFICPFVLISFRASQFSDPNECSLTKKAIVTFSATNSLHITFIVSGILAYWTGSHECVWLCAGETLFRR